MSRSSDSSTVDIRRSRGMPPPRKRRPWVPPQNAVHEVWSRFSARIFSDVTTVLPGLEQSQPTEAPQGRLVTAEFDEKAEACKKKVAKIVEEHKRVNQRYRDPHFDIDLDYKFKNGYCLGTLTNPVRWIVPIPNSRIPVKCPCLPKGQIACPCRQVIMKFNDDLPKAVKRVHKIFKDPKFSPGDASPADIKQSSSVGDCWLMSSLSALANMPEMIDRICVAKNTDFGVYGFLFYRDGEWIPSIIDDNLYLTSADWEMPSEERWGLMKTEREDAEKEHEEIYQRGSKALWGAHCRDQNETWLPLLEKAFAKAHGDYDSLDGGWPGEGLEDLTGGVTTELFVSDIFSIDDFWENELKKVNEEFLFGCGAGVLDGGQAYRAGIAEGHSYTIMEVKERSSTGEKLLKLRNPWGLGKQGSWLGAWSDGSKEWTPETLKELNHQQGIDSVFWILYEDFLRKFQVIDRTRLFSDPAAEWRLAQQWTSLDVPWNANYREHFRFTLSESSAAVIVLSQLDGRYFRGLEGQYRFTLNFRLHSINALDGDAYVARSHGKACIKRSVAVDLPELPKGTYCVFVKVVAERFSGMNSVEKVVEQMCRGKENNEKFSQVGMSYNMAHAKGARHQEAQMRAMVDEEWKKRKAREERQIRRSRKHDDRRRAQMVPRMSAEIRMPAYTPGRRDIGTSSVSLQADTIIAKPSTNASSSRVPSLQRSEAVSDQATAQSENNTTVTVDATITQRAAMTSLPRSSTPQPPAHDDSDTSLRPSSVSIDSDDSSGSDSDYQRTKLRMLSYDLPPGEDDNGVEPWNAVCMVGLRVYSKDPELRVEVIMPGRGQQTGLDIDDKCASMVAPAVNEEGKGTELPLRRMMTL